ncbi:MAG TPA: marine proteobacterial sortase target protein, partial [Xanthomonadales bacterium]|nr:marine proteobacterial sortase target protein [Xanthomonadales bacterium]
MTFSKPNPLSAPAAQEPPTQRSIRQHLEQDAWLRYPEFAGMLQQRRLTKLRQQAHRREQLRRDGCFYHPVVYRWQNRGLLALCLLLATLFLLRSGTAQAQALADETWGLEFHGDGQQQQAVALDTLIDADINGLVARVDVQQRFRNTGRHWSEAVYRFPLPVGAAVDRLHIRVGQRVIEGEIKEKQEARRQYQQARDNGVIAALVDQPHANRFETRLANIGPDEEITVSISFLQRVDFREGEYSLQIPFTFTPRWDAASSSSLAATTLDTVINPDPAGLQHGAQNFVGQPPLQDHRLELQLKLRSALQLKHISSRFHDMDIHPGLGGYDLSLVNPDTRTDRMFELNWAPDLGSAPQAALSTWDDGDSVFALLMLAPPLAEATEPQEREVVFIIDTSGSMQGLALDQARAALYQGLSRLKEGDLFNLVEFNSDSYTLFHSSVPADGNYLEEALNFIEGLEADGGTNMAPALHDAMTLPAYAARAGQPALLRQIVFITDGSVGNEQELVQQIAQELGDSRLFTVSIGSAPNTGFMRKAAEIGRGSHTHIGQLEDVGQRMNQLWQRIEHPALQNIEVDWGMQADYYPEIIPDLYAGEPLWLVARLPAQPGQVVLRGDLNGLEWEQETAPHPGAGSDSLATLWARGRVEALQDSRLFLDTDAGALRQSIIDVALEFGLLTQYTSLVAVDHTPVRPAAEGLAQEQIANLLPAGSALQTQGFSATAAGWQWQLLGAVLLLLCSS